MFEYAILILALFFGVTLFALIGLQTLKEKQKLEGNMSSFFYNIIYYTFWICVAIIIFLLISVLFIQTFKITIFFSYALFSILFIEKVTLYFSAVLSFLIIIYIPEYFVYFIMKVTIMFDNRSIKTYKIYQGVMRLINLRIIAYMIAVVFAVIASLNNLEIDITIPFINDLMDQSITIEAVVTFIAIDTLIQMIIPELKIWKKLFEKE